MANKVFGIRALKINGKVYFPAGAVTINGGGVVREPVMNAVRLAGHMEKPEAATASFQIHDAADLDLRELRDLVDTTVTVDMRNGKTALMRNAFASGGWELNTETGEVEGQFTAEQVEWI